MNTNPVGSINLKADFPFFRRTWNRVVSALLAVSFLPLILIGGVMYVYSTSALKEKTVDALRISVLHHKTSLDAYIREREASLKLAAAALTAAPPQDPDDLRKTLAALHARLPHFTDIGIIDSSGRHVAYDGPYDLTQRNYKNSEWFSAAARSDFYISDVFLGFRNVPHVIVTVRQKIGDDWRLVRATLEASTFHELVRAFPEKGGTDAFLVNADGIFQTSPDTAGEIMTVSGPGPPNRFNGVRLTVNKDRIIAETWLDTVPWMFAAYIDRSVFSRKMVQVRNVALFIFFQGSILIVLTVLITTNYLVARLENKRKNLHILNEQLKRNTHSAAAFKLVGKILMDLKTSLVVMSDRIGEIPSPDSSGVRSEKYRAALEALTLEVNRNMRLLKQLGQITSPIDQAFIISEADVNGMIGELAATMVRGLFVESVSLETDFEPGLPTVRIERAQARRMVEEAIMTCLAGLGEGGTIRLVTKRSPQGIELTIHPRNADLSPVIIDHGETGTDTTTTPWEDWDGSGAPPRHWTTRMKFVREKERAPHVLVQFIQPADLYNRDTGWNQGR